MSRIRADQLVNRVGSGGPKFPNGVAEGFSVSGIVTATSFAGNLSGDVSGNVTGNADTATTATNAQGLTGNPNITVGTVTGTDATFSGNLTVQGTTTTIDTAVIALDSLQIDGNVAIGTITAGRHLTVSGGASEGAIQITNNTSGHTAANGFELIHFTSGETQFLNRENGDMRFDTNGTERLRITSTGKCEVYKGTSATGKTSGSEAFTVGNGAGNKRFSVYPDGTTVIGGQGTIANNNILLQNDGNGTFGSIDVSSTSTDGVRALGGSGQLVVQRSSGASGRAIEIYDGSTRTIDIFANGTATFAGTISDKLSVDVRRVKINNVTNAQTVNTSNYSSGDAIVTVGGGSVTFEGGASGLAAGSMITVVNNHSSNCTLTQGTGVTLRFTDGTTGNKTLAGYGVATILYITNAVAYITGSGVS